MVEATDNNWEEQGDEVESLQYIYPEELVITSEKPYNFDIVINSNTESEDMNFLKLKITFNLQDDYPNQIPYFKVKNMSPDYIDNAVLDAYEDEMRELAQESLGSMMIFQMCDLMKEKIVDINDKVLEKLRVITEAASMSNALKTGEITDITHLTYTPVNAETFGAWCVVYKKRLLDERYQRIGNLDERPTGKQLFLLNANAFDDLTLEEEDEEDEEDSDDDAEKPEAAD